MPSPARAAIRLRRSLNRAIGNLGQQVLGYSGPDAASATARCARWRPKKRRLKMDPTGVFFANLNVDNSFVQVLS